MPTSIFLSASCYVNGRPRLAPEEEEEEEEESTWTSDGRTLNGIVATGVICLEELVG
jgi:hypothetical protein